MINEVKTLFLDNPYLPEQVRAYYLFGLGLRQEVLRAMEADG